MDRRDGENASETRVNTMSTPKDSANEPPAVLIVTMGTDYVAPARMPFELQRAGFRVAMLAPRESLAAHTAHCDLRGFFPSGAKLIEWLSILADWIGSVAPVMILPADDVTVRTLFQLALEPPPGVPEATAAALKDAIVRSLGNPAGWIESVDKTLLFELARSQGLAVADGGIATTEDEAIAIAERLGYPTIIRTDYGSAGGGAARCLSAIDVRAAIRGHRPPEAWRPSGPTRFLVQRWVDGNVVTRASLAWQGREIAGVTRGRLATYGSALGFASVVEYAGIPQVQAATARLFELFGIHGFVGTQFVVENETETPYLVEINRRIVPTTHGARIVGIDLAQVLRTMIDGGTWGGPQDLPPGPGARLQLFPQEWYRDEASAWLRNLASDAPWHDPPLLEAMVRLHAFTKPGHLAAADRGPTPSSVAGGTS
jgi:hypothetical protein